jgi:membrane-bound lytic murein transglycosylase D
MIEFQTKSPAKSVTCLTYLTSFANIAAPAYERVRPVSSAFKRQLALTALLILSACSQLPWEPQKESTPVAKVVQSSQTNAPALPSGPGKETPPAQFVGPALAPVPAPAPEPVVQADSSTTKAPGASMPSAAVASTQANVPGSLDGAPPAKVAAAEEESSNDIDVARPADDLWERIRRGFAMPNLESALVHQRERWYASQPDYLRRMVERSKLYLFYIVEEIEKRGIPTEIALLPMVESAFNPMAYSRSHASGLWQFIPSTGRKHQLTQNWWTDGRRDVIASTDAALDYLESLYEMYGDWHLALASYNLGENGVTRAIQRNKARGLPTDYQSLRVPRETRGYVPKLQALKNIISNPEAFGVTLEPIPNEPYFATVPADRDIDILIAAKLAEMSPDELIALNPALNRPVISGPHTQVLVLPADRVDTFQRNLEAYDQPLTSWQPYTMKRGDSLDRLAAKHGVAVSKLRIANGITSRSRVGPGSQLLLPIKGSDAAAEPLPAVFRQPSTPARRGGLLHIVRKGETLYGIARRYHVTTDSLRRWNHIGVLTTGQRLRIYGRGPGKVGKVERAVRISGTPHKEKVTSTLLPLAQR